MVVWLLGRPFRGPDCPRGPIMTGHLNDNLVVLTALQGSLRETVWVLFGPKIGLIFLCFTCIAHFFSRARLNSIITIVLSIFPCS